VLPYPSPIWLDHSNYTWGKAQVPKLPIMHFTSTFLFRLLCGLLIFIKTLLVFLTLCRFLNFKL
jgi:hypothetical protein